MGESTPASTPTAVTAAKPNPWLRVKKKMIGPDVSGSAMSQPLMVGPQRRPARLAPPTRMGVRMSLSARLSTRVVRVIEHANHLQPVRLGPGIARQAHAHLEHHALRAGVGEIGIGQDALELQRLESMVDHRPRRLAGIALALVRRV